MSSAGNHGSAASVLHGWSLGREFKPDLSGVSDGIRTRDNRDHNPVLYQLSYTHRVHPLQDQARPDAQRPIVPGPDQCSEPDRGLGCEVV